MQHVIFSIIFAAVQLTSGLKSSFETGKINTYVKDFSGDKSTTENFEDSTIGGTTSSNNYELTCFGQILHGNNLSL